MLYRLRRHPHRHLHFFSFSAPGHWTAGCSIGVALGVGETRSGYRGAEEQGGVHGDTHVYGAARDLAGGPARFRTYAGLLDLCAAFECLHNRDRDLVLN